MNDSNIIPIIEYLGFFVILIFVVVYLYAIIWAMIEGKRRDLLNIGLIGVAILGTPLMAIAFVKSAKSDMDRIRIEYLNSDGRKLRSSLSYWKKLKLNTSSIIHVEDINNFCRFCNTQFSDYENNCINCGKERLWYRVMAYSNDRQRKELFDIKDLPKIKEEYKIKGIKRYKNPLTQK